MAKLAGDLAARATLHCADSKQATSASCTATLTRQGANSVTLPQCTATTPAGPAPCWYRSSGPLCLSGTQIVLVDSEPLSETTMVSVQCS